ncbi:MAG: hypothetical protein ACMG6H_12615 [Acidobacteriota bacterium]
MSDDSAHELNDESRAQIRAELIRLLNNNGIEFKEHAQGIRYEFVGEYGQIVVHFAIGPTFFDWAFRISNSLTRRTFGQAIEILENEGKIKRSPDSEIAEDETDVVDSQIAGFLAFLIIAGMGNKLWSAVHELGLETEQIFDGFLREQIKQTDLMKQFGCELHSIAANLKAFSKSLANERRQFLIAQIEKFSDKPHLERLPDLYPKLLKVWQSAKKIYADYGESETWRNMVKAKYPELTFDDDLLTRVTGRLAELPEDIQAKLSEKDGDHTPNTIALEHAARMCGATPYQFGTRYYHNLKTPNKTEQAESE